MSIRKLLRGREMTVAQIKRELGTDAHLSAVLGLMCDQGLAVRVQAGSGWDGRSYKYALFADYYPGTNLNCYSEPEASALLIRRYLSAFGPAALEDLAWWIGVGKTKVKEALSSIRDMTSMRIKELDGEFLILKSDMDSLAATKPFAAPEINFLPNLDPYLMGYKRRERYLDPEFYDFIFDRGGNVTSTILLNGRVIGVWDFDGALKTHYFRRSDADTLSRLHEKADALGRFIAGHKVELRQAASMVPLRQRTAGAFMSPLKEG